MSASIRAPWLHDYLLQIAEENGGNLISVAFESKGRRAQLVKWLTYPQDDDKEVFMWAIISDKVHTVEVRFSKEAVKSLRQNPLFLGRNVTEYRTAIVIIKTFRPFCTRVPQGRDKGMSLSEHICLEVNDFSLSGAFNEPVWGSPRPIGTQSDIREWVQGLRQGGGAGNVLKLRKAANSADVVAPAESVQGDPERAHLEEIPPKLNPRKVMLAARKPVLANPPIELPAQRTEPTHVETKDNSTGVYLRKWKACVPLIVQNQNSS
ncbi:uncharacterized protein C8Q71DRAFT_855938 [Rhodofomes roseus]|uniref:Telomere replication protein EST3 n=1 Tax=Rhodofomes roseus TaxID=34475 RepID=A0ABQ8KM75_9APHY|nr:uncharacterized protein C8Q71DRAFT_855938 [Rhodofomes roseus]KAH9839311.1 hypothetical protein C8Q71DRAFT_855938 [Rhodofomes roseus]